MSAPAARHVSRYAAELAAAALTFCVGAAIVLGSREYGTGWTDAGPEAGAFPFYVGIVVVAASLGNALQAWRRRRERAVFASAQQIGRIAAFAVPMALFVAACVFLGFYVATVLYLGLVMRFQGHYGWWRSALVALGTSAFFFVVLELWFKVALLKGPLEAALGIH
jgi:putative tricarboxylic transport membrane protein